MAGGELQRELRSVELEPSPATPPHRPCILPFPTCGKLWIVCGCRWWRRSSRKPPRRCHRIAGGRPGTLGVSETGRYAVKWSIRVDEGLTIRPCAIGSRGRPTHPAALPELAPWPGEGLAEPSIRGSIATLGIPSGSTAATNWTCPEPTDPPALSCIAPGGDSGRPRQGPGSFLGWWVSWCRTRERYAPM